MRQNLNALVARIADQQQQPAPKHRRRPISDKAKLRMIAVLHQRGLMVSSRWADCSLVGFMKDSRRQRVTCDECNGTGRDTSPSYPEPCPVCNGKRYILKTAIAATGSTAEF